MKNGNIRKAKPPQTRSAIAGGIAKYAPLFEYNVGILDQYGTNIETHISALQSAPPCISRIFQAISTKKIGIKTAKVFHHISAESLASPDITDKG